MGGDGFRCGEARRGGGFNPRPRMGGDPRARDKQQAGKAFQSTPPHGGRRERIGAAIRRGKVSIHAPAWGATGNALREFRDEVVSIHAPAWGATTGLRHDLGDALVSIHAPAWGATVGALRGPQADEVSIHAPAWGATSSTTTKTTCR